MFCSTCDDSKEFSTIWVRSINVPIQHSTRNRIAMVVCSHGRGRLRVHAMTVLAT